jgi:hypothetical protein
MDSTLTITRPGTFNAVRLVTKNLLAIQASGAGPEWSMGYLVMPLATPLATPLAVTAGDKPHGSFDYRPATSLNPAG